jgi:hypothetical protein
MRTFANCRILLLTLILVVSQVALANHVTIHSGSDMGQCALCFSHAKTSSGTLQSSSFSDQTIPGVTHVNPPRKRLVQHVVLPPYQTRAPPFII